MPQRLSRTFLVFTAVALLLAGIFLSRLNTQSIRPLDFGSHSFTSFLPGKAEEPVDEVASKASPAAEAAPSPDEISPSSLDEPTPTPTPSSVEKPSPELEEDVRAKSQANASPATTATADAESATGQASDGKAPAATNATSSSGKDDKNKVLVEIVETNGYHEEVLAALIYGFGSQENVELDLYMRNLRFGIGEILDKFKLANKLPEMKSADELAEDNSTHYAPDILVSTTCELDVVHLADHFEALLKGGKTFLYCVIHHADRWNDPNVEKTFSPWVENGLMDFVALSPHTANFLKDQGLKGWNTTVTRPVKSFVPVFPAELPAIEDEQGYGEGETAFALQGNYEAARRDFEGIFSSLQTFIEAPEAHVDGGKEPNVTLHLLGSGTRPSVPEAVQGHVFFDENLSFSDYYIILSRQFALLPAFANDEYLDRKASSSVPASLLGGVPLVAGEDILAAYKYLPRDIVYLRQEDENEFDVIEKVLKSTPKDRKKQMSKVRQATAEMVEGNVVIFGKWLKEALAVVDGDAKSKST